MKKNATKPKAKSKAVITAEYPPNDAKPRIDWKARAEAAEAKANLLSGMCPSCEEWKARAEAAEKVVEAARTLCEAVRDTGNAVYIRSRVDVLELVMDAYDAAKEAKP